MPGTSLTRANDGGPGSNRQWLALRVIGAGLLFATGAIHLDLYLTGYRTIPTIGWLFLFQVITAFGLGAIILVSNSRLAAAAGAGFVMVDQIALYAAQYSSTSTALADLEAVERLHREEFVGSFDAAVIDKDNGKPHIVKRMDRLIAHIIPEAFGSGKLPRKELKDAASELTSNTAGLIAVGEPTVVNGIDTALTGAVKVAKHSIDASTDEIASELQEALKG